MIRVAVAGRLLRVAAFPTGTPGLDLHPCAQGLIALQALQGRTQITKEITSRQHGNCKDEEGGQLYERHESSLHDTPTRAEQETAGTRQGL